MAKLEFTCTYANCRKTAVPIVCTMPDERARFCCMDHVAIAMVRRAWVAAMGNDAKAAALAKIETQLRNLIGDGS